MRLCVCLFVKKIKVQRSKKHEWSIRGFRYPALFHSGSEVLGIHSIVVFQAGGSTNQVSTACEFNQPGFEELRVQPVR